MLEPPRLAVESSQYIPIMGNGSYTGASFAGIPKDTVIKTINSGVLSIIGIFAAGILVSGIALYIVIKVDELSAVSEENSAATQETMAGIEELNANINRVYEKTLEVDTSADTLKEDISIFII